MTTIVRHVLTPDDAEALLKLLGGADAVTRTKVRAILKNTEVSAEPVAWVTWLAAQYFGAATGQNMFRYAEDREFRVPLFAAPQPQSAGDVLPITCERTQP